MPVKKKDLLETQKNSTAEEMRILRLIAEIDCMLWQCTRFSKDESPYCFPFDYQCEPSKEIQEEIIRRYKKDGWKIKYCPAGTYKACFSIR
jgi:hypothetical protein